ncbi:dephospho-CoA kinase-like isoform X2 [Amphibalanus amphitrite]|uniref:dephospho-CoA kinase-like isoform X2 n=1 Tax=Amphibalanus amphitrite TaxID=1232801 RepID=UPI001C909210|nr:dephospho-CoA kinase-like isoform X2 [Amphibalanus amphitrite]
MLCYIRPCILYLSVIFSYSLFITINRLNMFLVGLTGGIATGKSTVSKLFQDEGVPVVDADVIARKVVEPGRAAWHDIRRVFGPSMFLENGEVDRVALGRLVFSDEQKRRQLNKITHNRIQRLMIWETLKLLCQGHQFAILDMPLLFESGAAVDYMEKIIVVSCEEDIQLSRLMERSGQSEDECRRRIDSQLALSTKRQHAHFVIENSGSRLETAQQVRRVLSVLRTNRAHWRLRGSLLLLVIGCVSLTLWVMWQRSLNHG